MPVWQLNSILKRHGKQAQSGFQYRVSLSLTPGASLSTHYLYMTRLKAVVSMKGRGMVKWEEKFPIISHTTGKISRTHQNSNCSTNK